MNTERINYDVDYFLSFFEAIPDAKWMKGTYRDPDDPFRRCAYGHCGVQICSERVSLPKAGALTELFASRNMEVTCVNDCLYPFGDTPKQRILTVLRQIKAAQDAAAEAFETRPLTLTPTMGMSAEIINI